VQRVISETRAGKREVDFIENNSPEMEALRRENMLRAWIAALRRHAPGHARRPSRLRHLDHRRLRAGLQHRQGEAEELPKTFATSLDPRWKGRLGIEAEDQAWFGTLLTDLGEDAASSSATSWPQRHLGAQGPHAARQPGRSGEVPLALTSTTTSRRS
jgi:iron(III) transport system substrate-binding protein